MEHPHDPYHIRPFPQQPHRGGKALVTALADLETSLTDKVPDIERLKAIHARIHEEANKFNDDRLVDMIRQITNALEKYEEKPEKAHMETMLTLLLKMKVELKHL